MFQEMHALDIMNSYAHRRQQAKNADKTIIKQMIPRRKKNNNNVFLLHDPPVISEHCPRC